MRQEEFVYQKISEDFSFVMDCFSTMLDKLGETDLAQQMRAHKQRLDPEADFHLDRTAQAYLIAFQLLSMMVRGLLPSLTYNENYEKIEDYLSRNINNYVDEQEVVGEHRIFMGQYYGASLPLLNWKNQSSAQIFVTWFS